MNVKPGDLARVVAHYTMNGRGAFVQVVRRLLVEEILEGQSYGPIHGHPVWVVRGWVRDSNGVIHGPTLGILDSCLRRVDPGDGVDEVLRRVGLPRLATGPAPSRSTITVKVAAPNGVWKPKRQLP
jgi:hypothetical protein